MMQYHYEMKLFQFGPDVEPEPGPEPADLPWDGPEQLPQLPVHVPDLPGLNLQPREAAPLQRDQPHAVPDSRQI